MFYTYVLYSDEFERFYVGMTETRSNRLKEHNKGNVTSTKSFVPWRVVLVEEYKDSLTAREREKYLKSAAGRRWRKENINSGM
jgi:putative endonuclease